ncbi:MAG: hypothetical protein IKA68_04295 [Clostridia bacterium]|nr:hypothetical protein [Clostridia bacterium]
MKLFTRIICLLLVCCFIGMTMISCKKDKQNGDNDGENSDNSSNQTEKQTNEYGEESFSTVVPTKDLDFEGEQLTILIRDNVQNSREWTKETTEDELDEAIAMRNSAVADTLNVQVVFELIPSPSHDAYIQGLNSMITTDVDSDMHYYDIGCNFSYYCTSSVLRGYSANLLDDVWFPYFDFSLPCWNQAIVEDTTFNDRLHYVAGDINLSMFDAAIVMWHNKTLYDAKREDNDPENIQDLALAGLWTYEDLYRWASVFYENSNGTEGRQVDDTYALCMYTNDPCPVDALPYAWDLEFVIENNDKTHNFNIEGNEKAEEALNRFRNLFNGVGTQKDEYQCSTTTKNFAAGRYIFFTDRIFWNTENNMAIREMEDKYGLLPLPKYDAEQEQYGTTAQDYYNLLMVIDHAESSVPTKGEAVSAYLQLSCEESYTGVRGYYFNRIIKPKFFGTDDSEGTVTKSIALFDIIVDNIEFDYCTIYSPQLNNVNHLWRGACYSDNTLEYRYQTNKEAYEKAIMETDAWLGLRAPIEE